MDPAQTLKIPQEGFVIVQQLPKNDTARTKNTLYLAPRSIEKREFDTPELYTFIDSMYAVMIRAEGVGIAANQLGKRLQIFIIEAASDNPRYQVLGAVKKQIFLNPRITKVSAQRKNFWHGCLSAQDEKRGNVATYEWIEYECVNPKGEVEHGRLDGFASVIFQHEFRHLLNGTYLDHAHQFFGKEELNQKIEAGELPFFERTNDTLPLLIEGYRVGETLDQFHARKP